MLNGAWFAHFAAGTEGTSERFDLVTHSGLITALTEDAFIVRVLTFMLKYIF